MPRQARIDIEGQLYHVIARGIERRKIFIDADDYNDFLARLEAALTKTGGRCLAWCLMPNHFHLLILRAKRPLSELMRRLMTGYAVGFNIKHRRTGHLFQNRYKGILCEQEEYLQELIVYIHLNPLRAKLVRNIAGLEKYRWCSHGALIGRNKPGFMERDHILSYFGNTGKQAVQKYEALIRDRQDKYKGGEYSGGGLIKSMGGLASVLGFRGNGEKEMFDDRILGSGNFVEAVLKGVEEPSCAKMSRQEAANEVERITGVGYEELSGKSRERRIVRGRAAYCYLRREKGGASGTELMKELGVTSGTVSYLVHRGRELLGK